MAQNCIEWAPTKAQAKVLEAALDPALNQKITVICKKAGVPHRTFYNWLKTDPEFKEAWTNVWRGAVGHHLPGVVLAMLQTALLGDVPAAKLVLTLTGISTDKIEHTGPNGSPLPQGNTTNNIQINVSLFTDDELGKYEELLTKIIERSRSGIEARPPGEGQALPSQPR